MPTRTVKYNPRYLGDKDTTKLKTRWDNDLIMDWIETQPNPLEAPEFYQPMVEHDPPQITLRREIREQLGQVWSLDHDFVHPLALEFFENEDEKAALEAAAEAAEAAEAVLASLREMGIEDARLVEEEEESEDDYNYEDE
ncbi:hypothetical protein VMCG_07851 [Cytospora schulzeri]|uniref:Uncharacterized protein n=1 Tax=Cytospora schulzeri TaxID=448051 RepID=A0A423W0J3_9PEZI|nr:hypothetical protein VMCG_07851 [Valsa malicola]